MKGWWEAVAPYARPERYGHREAGQERIEIRAGAPRSLLRVQGECANCGRAIFPVRERTGYTGGMYIAVTCHADGCSRSQRARDEYTAALRFFNTGEHPDSEQPRLC